MLGAFLLAFVIVVVIPMGALIGGAVLSAILGWFLKDDVEAAHEGSEVVDLNY